MNKSGLARSGFQGNSVHCVSGSKRKVDSRKLANTTRMGERSQDVQAIDARASPVRDYVFLAAAFARKGSRLLTSAHRLEDA